MAETNETPEPSEISGGSNQAEKKVDTEELEISTEARNLAMLCHLLGLVGFLGPLIAWLVTKDQHKFADEQGKESLNFQLSLLIYFAISGLLCFLLIGFLLIGALVVLNIIFVVIAATRASDGRPYRYPIAIRFIK